MGCTWQTNSKKHCGKLGKYIENPWFQTWQTHLYCKYTSIYMIDIHVKKLWHKPQYTKYLSLLATIDTFGP